MRALILLLLVATSAEATPPQILTSVSGRRFYATGQAQLDTALTYVGASETRGNNRGPQVDRFTRIGVRMNPPIYWCAAFTSYCRRQATTATGRTTAPYERAGVPYYGASATQHLVHGGVISAAEVWRGARVVPPGSIVVWRNGESWTGHIGFVWKDDDPTSEGFRADDRSTTALSWRSQCGLTVEGNTGPGEGGSQRDGGGVYQRRRCLSHSYFKIVGFITP